MKDNYIVIRHIQVRQSKKNEVISHEGCLTHMRSWPIKNCWNRITKTACLPSQTAADVAAIVCCSPNVHKCICNAVSVSLFLMCFQIVCWKLWFIIASLVYSLVSCGAAGPNAVACLVRIKLLGALTSARGPLGNRSSHLRTDTQTEAHSEQSKSALAHLILRGIDCCLPTPQR